MTSKQNETAKKDLQDYAEKLLNLEMNVSVSSDLHSCDKIPKKPQVPLKALFFTNTSSVCNCIIIVHLQVLWCIYFNMKDTSEENLVYSSHKNVHICSGPDAELDFDHAVQQVMINHNKIFLSQLLLSMTLFIHS